MFRVSGKKEKQWPSMPENSRMWTGPSPVKLVGLVLPTVCRNYTVESV